MNQRRKYSTEFKQMVVDLLLSTGKSQAELEREYAIGASCISRWVQEFLTHKEEAFPGNGQLHASEAELAALRRQVKDLSARPARLPRRCAAPRACWPR